MVYMKVREIRVREVEVPELGKKIVEAQKASGISVTKVCAELGFSSTYWYKLTKDREDSVKFSTLQKIEQVLRADFGIKFDEE